MPYLEQRSSICASLLRTSCLDVSKHARQVAENRNPSSSSVDAGTRVDQGGHMLPDPPGQGPCSRALCLASCASYSTTDCPECRRSCELLRRLLARGYGLIPVSVVGMRAALIIKRILHGLSAPQSAIMVTTALSKRSRPPPRSRPWHFFTAPCSRVRFRKYASRLLQCVDHSPPLYTAFVLELPGNM